jgi:Zn-dependent metalloprotease
MSNKATKLIISCALIAVIGVTANAAPNKGNGKNAQAIERLKSEQPGIVVSVNSATETASFVRLPPGQAAKVSGDSTQDTAVAFVSRHAQAFGLRVGSTDLKLSTIEEDSLGRSHVRYKQEYGGVPVFGAALSVHFDAGDQLVAVTGTLVPDLNMSLAPSRSAVESGDIALNWVASENDGANLAVRGSQLLIFRAGLAKGVPGKNHLAYEVEVGNGIDVREFVYVDAHTGKFIDQISGIADALFRRAYDGMALPFVPPSYPGMPFWSEGDPLPTTEPEADNMIVASKETYDVFANAFGRDSYDGAGRSMDSIFNRGYGCPNASWNGFFISFCAGLTTDDITGHEWGHAYTEFTDDLIYQWQPGALNESYSDVVGETVDRINGRDDLVAPNGRTDGSCSIYDGAPPPTLTVNDGSAAGSYFVTASVNEPPPPFTVGPLPMAVADPADGCGLIVSDVAGKIAIIDWSVNGAPAQCGSFTRATNAVAAGAAGIIFVAPAGGRLNLGSRPDIASVQVSNADGATIKAGLAASATMDFTVGADDSYSWLMGEDASSLGLSGALRDMWNPGCFGDPGKVSDEVYHCAASDAGGVHSNSGIPNHAFALLVDGGNYNGQSVNAIGLTKSNHIAYRAKTHYQGPVSDFVAHADALEQSCDDLIGTNLESLLDGSPSGEMITAADCAEVAKAILAVELRTPPSQCSFQPLLAQNPPKLCPAGSEMKNIFEDEFEKRNKGWTVSRDGTTPDFTPRDWTRVSDLPDDRAGKAYFGADPVIGTCGPGGDESAVLHLDSPKIKVRINGNDNKQKPELRMAFDHWVATEIGWDGGNLKISVNGGPWTLVDFTDFVYNSYNVLLFSAAQGNTNPIAGEQAFSGTDGGAVDGSWGRSVINLQPYALPGDEIQLRFDIGTDGCNGAFGWYVDNVNVYQCKAE